SRGPNPSASSGASSAAASSRSASSRRRSCSERGRMPRCSRVPATCGRRRRSATSTASTRPSSATRRARRSSSILSSVSSSRSRGRPSTTPATTRNPPRAWWACSQVAAAWSPAISSPMPRIPISPARRRACPISATTRTSSARASPTSSTSPVPASRCKRPARPRWWRCTSPARASSRANATWPSAARPPCASRRSPAISPRRATCIRSTDTAVPSTRRARARSSAAAWRPFCSSASPTRAPAAITSMPSSRAAPATTTAAAKAAITPPSVAGQARAMVEAITLADVPPETIGYVECHATGTAAGDPLEIEALTRAFESGTERIGYCAVGSVKGNIGHPEQAAGLASLIKAALAIYHGELPPTLNFTTPNPAIGFAGSPFYVNDALRSWASSGHPRRAGINSLGIGGTNAFVVLEQGPEPPPSAKARPAQLLTLSAKSDAALHAYVERFRERSRTLAEADLADVCYTSNLGRSQLPVRFAASVATLEELRAVLGEAAARGPVARSEPRPLAFVFSGQGSQWAGMGAELYRAHPIFREALDRCAALLEPRLDRPLLEVMFATAAATSPLDQTRYTQPALFALEYALAQLWLAWGIVPDALIGHSIGELTAACVAGMLSLEEALGLVSERGRLMQALPPGVMAAIMAAEDTVR